MESVLAFMLVILSAILFAGTKAQTNPTDSCLKDLTHKFYKTNCRDTEAWVACLKKMIDEKKDAPLEELRLEDQLEYHQRLQEEEMPCPLLEERGSCINNEMNLCRREFPESVTDECAKILELLSCLTTLNQTCSNKALIHHIESSNKIKKSCESGYRRKLVVKQRCYDEVTKCTKKFDKLYENKDYIEARKLIAPTTQCLKNIACDPVVSVKFVEDEKKRLDDFLTEYNGGAFRGKCGLTPIQECYAFFYIVAGRKRQVSLKCTKKDFEKAIKCMENIKPYCKTDIQQRYYKEYLEKINFRYCLGPPGVFDDKR